VLLLGGIEAIRVYGATVAVAIEKAELASHRGIPGNVARNVVAETMTPSPLTWGGQWIYVK
jgi:hypothetical protein